ncbi:ribosome biogenesis GTPase Der [Nitratiruptor sp. SB155-2]|uniref:GTPase Der n=1 Tax=Nitratiruptor sp. (strain SB155-2) TaxID=387092 RepID=DER_NITSB|nr:ribosome biogenesis GTPase Der [Nitratiruptor sp. SB155-2]A6Q4R8.1 RecName: Full=GTPase Der; AltName: Full=GTP-binding protein EngA [Nitratiruptor sp. SB155-2]BAF70477.1 GTP-binding protein, Era/ThdF family [Nitratiruptor sp. SB155-2]
MKKIAIIGKPNVGKSSLFNRILKQRDAIVSETEGTTRDVKRRIVQIGEKEAEILDTGGIEDRNELFEKVKQKSLEAAKDADIILYMVDGKKLPDEEDKQIFRSLQKLGKKIALVINKIDNDKEEENVWNFYEFGTQDIFPISVSHNRKVKRLLDWVEKQLPKKETIKIEIDEELDFDELLAINEGEKKQEESNEINVAILGRVNVGKSSLLNALLKEERSIVSDVAGTTIDTIDESTIYNDKVITFIDTAGIRRRGKIVGIEKYALNRTQKMLERADVALLVLDASEGITEQDERIAGYIDKYKLACIIVLNKWDIAKKSYEEAVKEVRDRFKFLSFAPIITLSAKTRKRVDRLYDLILKVYKNYSTWLPTGQLNRVIKEAQIRHQIPSYKGKPVKILYATQYDTKPPKIALVMNRPEGLHFSYKRYLANVLRENFDLEGTPIILRPRKRGERDEEMEEESY